MHLNDFIATYPDFWKNSMTDIEAEMRTVYPELNTNPDLPEATWKRMADNFAIITPMFKSLIVDAGIDAFNKINVAISAINSDMP